MHLNIHPQSRQPAAPPAAGTATPAAPALEAPRDVHLNIDHIRIEGCGPVSPHALREGFRDTWMQGAKAEPRWTGQTARQLTEAFQSPIDLNLTASSDARQIGRALATAILQRLDTTTR